jgi:ABC-type nitrate/sulfonate/bicarbonate transport system substrate-binding protein/outer membrane protein OmpA-like peptidoglycan-associated protein
MLLLAAVAFAGPAFWNLAHAQDAFSKLVGPVKVEPVKAGQSLSVPYLTWGGDVATFHANGGKETRPNTLFAQQGLKLSLTPGDDFVGQVRNYLSGKTPFLRGTTAMLGMASEVIGADPRTKPVVFLQMTWSRGDHMVGREHVKDLNALKGKKVALQQGGPHVGLLDEILTSAQLTWRDITPVWVAELTGDKGAAALFRNDKTIDACMVISPDMAGLTGGLESVGTGAEGTIKGGRVVISTATMNRAVADVYACRKDYYEPNKATVDKFSAAYLKACEEIVDMKKAYDAKNDPQKRYLGVLKLTQDIYGKEVIPTPEVDADGLIADCEFVGLPGNELFFKRAGNPVGFAAKEKSALDLATSQGYARVRAGWFGPDFDFDKLRDLGKLTKTTRLTTGEIDDRGFIDIEKTTGDAIFSFAIQFEPNQNEFRPEIYGPQFQQVVDQAARFGNAAIVVTGHADPTATLRDLVQGGTAAGVIRAENRGGVINYYFEQKPLDLTQTDKIVELITKGAFGGTNPDPRATMQAALNLSRERSVAVRQAIIDFAKSREYLLDSNRIVPTGVGISQPLVAKPKSLAEAKRNMRVEFKLMRVSGEVSKAGEFDF